jgi:amino acid transporter
MAKFGETGATSGGMFVRKSSGLVRSVSTLDVLFYCIIQLSIAYVMLNFAVYAFYPGASMEWAAIIALIGSLCVGITYALFASVYPRSGGEYVFLSRTIHPFVGFVASFVNTFWQIFYFGINGGLAASIGLAPFFTMLGFQMHNETLTKIGVFINTPAGWFVIGIIMIAFFGYQLYIGMRAYFSLQKWAILIALAGLLIFIITLALGSSGVLNFHVNFDAYAGAGAFDKFLVDAKSQGVDLTPAMSWPQTANFIIWPAFSFLFAVLSVSFSGEIKDVKRGQLYAITGANIIGGGLLLLITYFGRHAIGDTFLRAASSLGAVAPLPYPWLTLLASVLGNNIFLTVCINLSVVLLLVYVAASTAIYATRGLLAWAIDGMAPNKLAEVSQTRHTPTYVIIVTCLLALGCLALYSFTNLVRTVSGIVPMGFVFGLVAFVGMLFPYIKREAYETSPARIEIAGIPLMTITGFIGGVITAFVVYRGAVDNTFAANSPFSLGMIAVVFIVGAVWYFVARAVRSRQGVDMDARFKEIPIE